MGRKSSKAVKGRTLASTSAAASASVSARGASTSPTNRLHGCSGSSASGSASTTAGPASLTNFPPLGSSSYVSSQSAAAWWRGSSSAIGEGGLRMEIVNHIHDLKNNDRRGYSLNKLAKMGAFPDLALYLWHSFGTMAILLQEVISIYPMMSQSSLTAEQSTRACDVLALFQCVASHPTTKKCFIRAHIPEFLCPFLSKTGDFRDFEHIRIATLGVIGALVKVPDTDVIIFLLSLEIMPICLCAMERGTEMSRTVAAFILQGLLQDHVGLQYICHVPIRLSAVLQALGNVIAALSEKPSVPLLKQAVKCYLHLLQDQRSLKELKRFFPKRLCDGTFNYCVRDDQTLRKWLQQLLDNVQGS